MQTKNSAQICFLKLLMLPDSFLNALHSKDVAMRDTLRIFFEFNSQNVKIDTASTTVTADTNCDTKVKMTMRILHICLEISYTLKVDQDCLFFLYPQTNPGILLYLLMEV